MLVLFVLSCSKDEIKEVEPFCHCVKTTWQSRHGISYTKKVLKTETVECQDEVEGIQISKEVKGIDLVRTWYVIECNN